MFVQCSNAFAPYFPNSKNSHFLHDYHRRMLFTQCFMYYQTSWNKTFYAIFSSVSKCKNKIFPFAFLKISMFHLCTFPVTERIISVNFSLKKKRWYIWKLEITTNEYLIFPDGIYLFKVNSRSTRIKCKICSKLTIKTQNDVSGG